MVGEAFDRCLAAIGAAIGPVRLLVYERRIEVCAAAVDLIKLGDELDVERVGIMVEAGGDLLAKHSDEAPDDGLVLPTEAAPSTVGDGLEAFVDGGEIVSSADAGGDAGKQPRDVRAILLARGALPA